MTVPAVRSRALRLLLALSLALPMVFVPHVEAEAGTVCRSTPVRVKFGRSRTPRLYVMETHCYGRRNQRSAVEELHSACDLMVKAYGKTEGQERCRALVENEFSRR